jgi:hypothetical protein
MTDEQSRGLVADRMTEFGLWVALASPTEVEAARYVLKSLWGVVGVAPWRLGGHRPWEFYGHQMQRLLTGPQHIEPTGDET